MARHKFNRSIASVGNTSQFYEISHFKEYEVETGGLSRDECLQVDQIDSDEKLNSVKFTWRFAENLPKVAVPESPGIFNDKFNPTFS